MSRPLYDALAAGYESSLLQTPYFAHLNTRYREILCENISRLRLSSLLDIGCGTGLFTDVLVAGTRHYLGIDLSLGMLLGAKRKSREIGLAAKVSLVRADAAHLPFRSEAIGGLVSVGMVLPHLASYEQSLAEISRVLHRNGRFLAEFDNKWSVDFIHYLADALTGGRIFSYGFSSLRQMSRYIRQSEYEWDARRDGLPTQRGILLHKISLTRLVSLFRSSDLRPTGFYGVHFATLFIPHSFPRDNDGIIASYLRLVEWLDERLSQVAPFSFLGGSLIVVGKRE